VCRPAGERRFSPADPAGGRTRAQLYGASFALQGLSASDVLVLAAIGGALGWLGAKISVLIHLRHIV
jgi:cell division protein FtsX